MRSTEMERIKQSLRMVRYLAREIRGAQGAKKAEMEALFKDEINLLRRYVSGDIGFAAMARSLIEPAFTDLGLRL